jgi:uncharacterized protein YlaN (UPF0358 family)
MVSLGYLGACLALTRSTSGMTKEEIEGLPKRCHGNLATLSQLQKMFPEKYDNITCPCCKRHEETSDHLWACPNEEMDLIVTNGLIELEEALKKWKTPIAVTKALMHGIRNWRQCQKGLGTAIAWSDDDIINRITDRDTADELVQKLMEGFASQSTIGWKYVFRGLVSEKWAEAFAYNYKGDNPVICSRTMDKTTRKELQQHRRQSLDGQEWHIPW